MSFYDSAFYKFISGESESSKKLLNVLGRVIDNLGKKYGGTGLTEREKEDADLQLHNQQTLNQEEYDRKVDFYNRFESPQAQVRQYEAAGLNPALMYQSGAGVSASGGIGTPGSAASPQMESGGLTALMGMVSTMAQMQALKRQTDADVRLKTSQAFGNELDNRWKDREHETQLRLREQEIDLKISMMHLNRQTLAKLCHETEYAQIMAQYAPELFQSQVDERTAAAENSRMSALLSQERIKEVDSIITRNQAEVNKIDAEVKQIHQNIVYLSKQGNLADEKAKQIRQEILESQERIKKIGAEIGLLDKDIEYYTWNHAKQVGLWKFSFPVTAATESAGEQAVKTGHVIGDDGQPKDFSGWAKHYGSGNYWWRKHD